MILFYKEIVVLNGSLKGLLFLISSFKLLLVWKKKFEFEGGQIKGNSLKEEFGFVIVATWPNRSPISHFGFTDGAKPGSLIHLQVLSNRVVLPYHQVGVIQLAEVIPGCLFTSAMPNFLLCPPPLQTQDEGLLPQGDPVDQFKPVVPWPRVEGVEVDLNSIRLKHHGEAFTAWWSVMLLLKLQRSYHLFLGS